MLNRKSLPVLLFLALTTVSVGIASPATCATDEAEYIHPGTSGTPVLDLQKMINDAVAAGRSKVTIPAGRFRLAGEGIHLNRMRNLILEGAGPERTTLVTDIWASTAVTVWGSQSITLRNFAVDREPVPFVQATITKISDLDHNRVAMDFHVHAGYPALTDRVMASLGGCGQFFDQKTRRLKQRDHWFGPVPGKNVLRIDDTHGRILLSTNWKTRVAEGDYVFLKSGNGSAFVLVGSDSVRMEDVAILASGSIGVGARFLTGENYFRYTIKPGPTPAGATQARLLATNADGMQYFWCPGAVTFEGCDFGFTGDDGINISIPQVFKVVEVQSPTRFLATVRMEAVFIRQMEALSKPGDIVRPLRYGTFEPIADLPLKSLAYMGHRKTQSGRELAYVTVELQQPPPAAVAIGDFLVPGKFLPERFAIRNSRFHDTRARGLLIMASNGVIENNTIEHTAMAGMLFLQEIMGFGGADWVSNVVVRNNVIRDTCFNDAGLLNASAAVMLCNRPFYPSESPRWYPWVAAHHNIRIVGNTVDGCDAAGILINGLDGGEVCDNVVENTHLSRGGLAVSLERGLIMNMPYAITVMNSRNVRAEGNRVSRLGPHATGKVGDLGVYPAAKPAQPQRPL